MGRLGRGVCNQRLGRRRRPTPPSCEWLEPRHLLAATTLVPVADTFTRASVAAGTSPTLEVRDANGVGGDVMAYLRFDLSGVDLTGLTNAYLTLQKIGGDTIVSGRFDTFGLLDVPGNTPQNWSESALATGGLGGEYTSTGGNQLDPTRVATLDSDGIAGADVIEQVSNSGSPQHLSGLDLVAFLRDRKAAGGLATFITLVDAGASRGWTYGSREHADPAMRPSLRLMYTATYDKNPAAPARQMERLDRGLVALRRSTSQVYLGWRLFGTDPPEVGFNVYRSANGGAAVRLNSTVVTSSTNFVDTTFSAGVTNTYHVRPVIGGVEQPMSETVTLAANAPSRQYVSVPLDIPPGGQMPDAANPGQLVSYSYVANDASVGDLDGDGRYEIVLKWMPSNEAHAGVAGYTGSTIFDAYRLDGTRLWRIDLGINIRSSAQYAPFLVYDLDGDGRAEVVSRTMPGTTDGLGRDVILPGDDPRADYRDSSGRIVSGPEYLTVFDGLSGAALATVPFAPDRRDISSWGDAYGHRGENIFMAPAYLDGALPSVVIGRGIYRPSGTLPARNEVTAWNWRRGQLTREWWFKAAIGIDGNPNSEYVGQGTHSMITADVDGDGRDEVVYGAMTVDHDGTGLYSTGRGHGDALHVSDMDPTNPGLEVFQAHEETALGNHTTVTLRDAATGRILAAPRVASADVAAGTFPDVGRGIALDIDPDRPGYEFWNSYDASIFDVQGNAIYPKPSNMHVNFGIWWDADLLRETLDNTTIGDWNHVARARTNLVSFSSSGINNTSGLSANNGTKSTPCLSGDILGDWREEVIWRTSDNTALQVWSTTTTATNRIHTLMHDPHYRQAIAWQNNGYNQPPNPGFFLGAGMSPPPTPNIYTVAYVPNTPPTGVSLSATTVVENVAVGTVVGRLTTQDSDAADAFTYTIVSGIGDEDNTVFRLDGDRLVTDAAIDFEAGATRSLRIRSTDARGAFVERSLTITVIDTVDDFVVEVATGQELIDPPLPESLVRLIKRGAGTLVLAAPTSRVGGTAVESGRVVVRSVSALGSGGLEVLRGGTVQVDVSPSQAGAVTLPAVFITPGSAGGRIDLGTSRVTFARGFDADTLATLLAWGRGDGTWTGAAGVTSSAVAAAVATGTPRALGWVTNGDGSLTVDRAAPGDLNLDGIVDVLDAAGILAEGRYDGGGRSATWQHGDANYDGVLDILDIAEFIGSDLFDTGGYRSTAQAGGVAATGNGLPKGVRNTAMEAALAAFAIHDTAPPTRRRAGAMAPVR